MAMNRFMGDSRIRNVYRGLARGQQRRAAPRRQYSNNRQRAGNAYNNMLGQMNRNYAAVPSRGGRTPPSLRNAFGRTRGGYSTTRPRMDAAATRRSASSIYNRLRRQPLQQRGSDSNRAGQALNAVAGRMNQQKAKLRNPGMDLQSAYRNRSTEQGRTNRAARSAGNAMMGAGQRKSKVNSMQAAPTAMPPKPQPSMQPRMGLPAQPQQQGPTRTWQSRR